MRQYMTYLSNLLTSNIANIFLGLLSLLFLLVLKFFKSFLKKDTTKSTKLAQFIRFLESSSFCYNSIRFLLTKIESSHFTVLYNPEKSVISQETMSKTF